MNNVGAKLPHFHQTAKKNTRKTVAMQMFLSFSDRRAYLVSFAARPLGPFG
jgi:hypothetical protein